MTQQEFDVWLQWHLDAFPGVAKWLSDLEDVKSTTEHWLRALEPVSLKSCKQATSLLLSDPNEKEPRGFSNHPRAIRRIASELDQGLRAKDYVGGERTLSCPACRDSGVRFVISPILVRKAREAATYDEFVEVAAKNAAGCDVACDQCSEGSRRNRTRTCPAAKVQIPPMPRFRRDRYIEMDTSWDLLGQWNAIMDHEGGLVELPDDWRKGRTARPSVVTSVDSWEP